MRFRRFISGLRYAIAQALGPFPSGAGIILSVCTLGKIYTLQKKRLANKSSACANQIAEN
jgi:hypothetical protein